MGLCAMLWPPTGDLYRHNMMYFDFQNMTLIIMMKNWPGQPSGSKMSR